MANKIYFRGQLSNEKFITFFRAHWVVLAPLLFHMIILFSLAIFTLIYSDIVHQFFHDNPLVQPLFFILFLMATVFYHYLFINLLNYFVDIVIITDHRIVDHKKTLFFKDRIEMIDLKAIQDISWDRIGFLPNVLKYGHIKVVIASSLVTKIIHHVPQIKFYFRIICEESLKYRPSVKHPKKLEY